MVQSRDVATQAIFSLRGKPLNCHGLKRDTVYKWIERKQMPAHKVGRLWKFKKEEVDQWVRKGGANEG